MQRGGPYQQGGLRLLHVEADLDLPRVEFTSPIGGILIQLKSEIEMRIVKHNAYWITKYYFEKDSKDFK